MRNAFNIAVIFTIVVFLCGEKAVAFGTNDLGSQHQLKLFLESSSRVMMFLVLYILAGRLQH